jgi:hypothetical protein
MINHIIYYYYILKINKNIYFKVSYLYHDIKNYSTKSFVNKLNKLRI